MSGGVWAVIPVKPLRGALRRLRPAFDGPVRRELQVAMLTDVLRACAGARHAGGGAGGDLGRGGARPRRSASPARGWCPITIRREA